MIIEEKEFKIESGSTPNTYDLYLKKVINKGKSNEREDWALEGYDMSMSTILSKLIHVNLNTKLTKCNLREFIQEYKKATKEITDLIK